jgi:membrane-associated phospholipid phosphatase
VRTPLIRQVLPLLLLSVFCPVVAFGQDTPAAPPAGESDATLAAPCAQHGLSTVFRCIWTDVRQLARPNSLMWLGAGGGLAAGSLLLDDEVKRSMRTDHQGYAVAVGENLGEAGLHFGVPAALYVVARTTRHPEAAALAITLVRAQVVNAVMTRSLKLIPRARPYQDVARAGHGSFPSGHASATFASATVLARRWGWHAGVPAFAVATFVGATRLQNLHHLSDVTFGAALGIASGLAINMPSRRTTVSPIVGPGVAGVTIGISGSQP